MSEASEAEENKEYKREFLENRDKYYSRSKKTLYSFLFGFGLGIITFITPLSVLGVKYPEKTPIVEEYQSNNRELSKTKEAIGFVDVKEINDKLEKIVSKLRKDSLELAENPEFTQYIGLKNNYNNTKKDKDWIWGIFS